MLMGGLAKLDAQPGEELLDLASASLHTGLKEYGHQAVANSFYSLAKLQHYDAELCAAVDQHVSQNLSDHRPQVCFLLAIIAQPPRSPFTQSHPDLCRECQNYGCQVLADSSYSLAKPHTMMQICARAVEQPLLQIR